MAAPAMPPRWRRSDADILVFMDGDGADDPASIAALVAPIRAGTHDFVIGSRLRGEREPGSMAWHQLAAGLLAGLGMRLLYGVRYTDMCAFRAIRRDALLAPRHARDDLWLEHRDADARRPRRSAHSRDSGPLSLPQRRRLQGRGESPRQHQGGGPHRRDLHPRLDPAADLRLRSPCGRAHERFRHRSRVRVRAERAAPRPHRSRRALRCSASRTCCARRAARRSSPAAACRRSA